MGCSLATSLVTHIKDFRRRISPDYLFIEPSEMVVTRELRDALAMARRDIRFELGPLVTLVDGLSFEAAWQERRALIVGQITGADVAAVSRCDLIDKERLKSIEDTLKQYHDGVLSLSTRTGLGVEEVIARVEDVAHS